MAIIPERYTQAAKQLATFSHLLYQKGFADANGGNLSVKPDENIIITTPTLESKGTLKYGDMVITDNNGNHLYGSKRASSELTSHLAVYRANPKAGAVIHSHPPYVCSYVYTRCTPLLDSSPETLIWTGEVCDIPFIMPGSQELAEKLQQECQNKHVVLLRNHGLITWGGNLREAWWRTEVFEHHCKISHLIQVRGDSQVALGKEAVKRLNELRKDFLKK
ncbi:MAG: hypothetical protein CVU12_03045 [Bacteroidetes bacterium HGW-Bacteroidetes-7]|jgi:L-fuculose-phosphate aldolase|nr:MAG: hypothetical protein CVU12_03045 [Bacteroidetes bacterium HGW-Bacteroidetes-7]